MEFNYGLTATEAYRKCCDIAEQCGYCVTWRYSTGTCFSVTGGDICGEVVLDWFHHYKPGPVKIEMWTSDAVYTS